MKKTLPLIFLFITTLVNGTTYYIDPAGIDQSARSGSFNDPWKTLAYACTRVTTPGDIIHVNSGNYVEYVQIFLAVGVCIEGEGVTSNIVSNVSKQYAYTIQLNSSSEGTIGNQTISNLKLDGNDLTAWGAIGINGRSNVVIHDLTIVNFRVCGVMFNGGTAFLSKAPNIHATGNQCYNNTITNCSIYENENGQGAIRIGGQEGLKIYNNNLTQIERPAGSNGYLIKYYSNGYNKGVKIFNNIITKAPYDGLTWDFAIELWNGLGGIEIYDNIIIGSIDIAGSFHIKGTYDYSVDIHNNTIGPKEYGTTKENGIRFEETVSDLIIRNNHFRNLSNPISFWQYESGLILSNIYIYNNIMSNVGTIGSQGWGIRWGSPNNTTVDNLNIYNNVIVATTTTGTVYGIGLPGVGSSTNIRVRNNIIRNFDYAPIYSIGTGSQTIDKLWIENNIIYENGNSNNPLFTKITPTNYINQNNIKSNPLFTSLSDFHLNSGSPGIGKGINVNLKTDYEGNIWKNPPSIGAYEYESTPLNPIKPVFLSASINNSTPTTLEMLYDLDLYNEITPEPSAFTVLVDEVIRDVIAVVIAAKTVKLTIISPISYGNIVTVAYKKPLTNPLRTPDEGIADDLLPQIVENKLDNPVVNAPPNLVLNYNENVFSGYTYEIDASSTTDPNNDLLSFSWTAPAGVQISSNLGSKIKYLSPVVNITEDITFSVMVNDGKATISKNFSIIINPYKPELEPAKVKIIEASSYNLADYPQNVNDGDITTKWSSNGDNQWLTLSLEEPFKIHYIQIALLPDQNFESFFDIYASKDNISWEPIIIKVISCEFSGNLQNYDFPLDKISNEYSYIKLIGHGSSVSMMNIFSEVSLFGIPKENPDYPIEKIENISIYPNPADDRINVSMFEGPLQGNQSLRIYDFAGAICFKVQINIGINTIQIPSNLKAGIYIAEVVSGKLVLYTQKLIIN